MLILYSMIYTYYPKLSKVTDEDFEESLVDFCPRNFEKNLFVRSFWLSSIA